MGHQTQTQLSDKLSTSIQKTMISLSNKNSWRSLGSSTLLLAPLTINFQLDDSQCSVFKACLDHELFVSQQFSAQKIKTLRGVKSLSCRKLACCRIGRGIRCRKLTNWPYIRNLDRASSASFGRNSQDSLTSGFEKKSSLV